MPRFIPDDVLDQIRLRADIVEVIQSYVPTLKRAGANSWKACCPFHQEKTPSFTVNPTRQSYKCFGCGKGGNVFTFVMEMEKLDFPNSAELLARKYGVVIPEQEYPVRGRGGVAKNNGGKDESDYNLRERLYSLHELLAGWYADNLSKGQVPEVCRYFSTRGISAEFQHRFMIGASPDAWSSAIDHAHKNGYTDEELRLSGIVSTKEENSNHIYDRFRNRLMFPIWNEQGRIVAFSARSVEKDPKGWKYVNSPESPVFKKSRTLYGLHFARTAIAEKKYALLCEGQLDVIAMHRAGCDNAVAAQGTAFGAEHAAILKRYTTEIRLALDNDKAGKKAVFADAEILLPLGFALRVVTWPDAKDADEVLKAQGAETIQRAVAESVDFFEFALRDAEERFDSSSPAGKARVAEDVLQKIQLLDSAATREAYLAWLASRLDLSANALRADLEKKVNDAKRRDGYRQRRDAERENIAAQPVAQQNVPAIPFSERNVGVRQAFRQLLQILLADEKLAKAAAHDIEEGLCDSTPVCRAVDLTIQFALEGTWQHAAEQILMELAKEGIALDEISGLITAVDETENQNKPVAIEDDTDEKQETDTDPILAQLDDEAEQNDDGQALLRRQTYDDCVRKIRLEQCRARMEDLMTAAGGLKDHDPGKLELLRELAEWSRRLREITRKD